MTFKQEFSQIELMHLATKHICGNSDRDGDLYSWFRLKSHLTCKNQRRQTWLRLEVQDLSLEKHFLSNNLILCFCFCSDSANLHSGLTLVELFSLFLIYWSVYTSLISRSFFVLFYAQCPNNTVVIENCAKSFE